MQFPKVICRYHRKNWLPITLLLLTSAPTFSVLQPVTIIMRSLEPRSNGPITTASKSPSHPADLGEIVVGIRAMVAQQSLGSERAVADALNVKRHQVRRALTAMRANGELGLAQAKRKALLGPDSENLVRATNPMEVIEMRIAIEPFLARLAALRASPFEIAAIQAAATTPVGMDLGMVDLKFHKLVAASSGNKLAASLYDLLRRVASDARVRLNANAPPCPKRTQQRDAEHRAIAQAILARDPDAAEQTMRLHLAAVQRRVIERLNPLAAAV